MTNPFRFSSKYQDDESDLLYYGYRYYNASLGRWLSRDPINENGFQLLKGGQRVKQQPKRDFTKLLPPVRSRYCSTCARVSPVGNAQPGTTPKFIMSSDSQEYQVCHNSPTDGFDTHGLTDGPPIDAPSPVFIFTQVVILPLALAAMDWGIYNYVCSSIPPDEEGFIRTPASIFATVVLAWQVADACGSGGGMVYMHVWSDRKCSCHKNYVIMCNTSNGPSA